MFTTQDLIASFEDDTRIIKHLATKLPNGEATLDYKPNAYQRSLGELLQYMTMMGTLMTKVLQRGSYDPEEAKAMRVAVQDIDLLNGFDAIMDAQLEVVSAYVNSLTPELLAEEIDPFGAGARSRKSYVLGSYHKNFTAYRMQLFCYLKDAGASELNSMNLWMGMDS